MLKNHLKTAFRNLSRYKGYSMINIAGFAIGIACCILILLWVQDELSYDRFHENLEDLYRVVEKNSFSDGTIFKIARTPYPVGPAFVKDYPEIINFTRFTPFWRILLKYEDKSFYERGFAFADPSFLEMFTLPLLRGDAYKALSETNSVLISEDMAKKYFGSDDPLGKTITMDNDVDFQVSGVFKNLPHNSHLQFDFLGPFETFIEYSGWSSRWQDHNYYTYVQLTNTTVHQDVEPKIFAYMENINPDSATKFLLQPVKDIHLRSDFAIDLKGKSENKAKYVYMFSLIALFILLIACINFMNLTTARASRRSLEIGMRKVIGANRTHLIRQFLGESILTSLLSLLIALVLVLLLLPAFNNISGKDLSLATLDIALLTAGLIGIALVTGVLSGSYPAFLLSAIKPIGALKGSLSLGSKNSALRKILVCCQFSLSIGLIIGTFVVYRQLEFIQKKNLGYNQEHVIYFAERGDFWKNYDAFKTQLQQTPDIVGITAASSIPTYTVTSTSGVDWEGKDPEFNVMFTQFNVDYDYFETLEMEMAQGRSFEEDFPTDATGAYILNETGARLTGLENPIGKTFKLWNKPGPIIGVVKDYHFKSLHAKIEPLVLRMFHKQWNRYVIVRIKSDGISRTLKVLEDTYKKYHPGYPFEFKFLDEELDALYSSDKQTGTVFRYFMFLAIFISCLGLFGLASFMAEQRTKEIGIRKVLGASVPGIFLMLLKEFVKWVLIASAISWPLAYYVMDLWLENFAYRTNIALWIFMVSGVLGLVVAVATVSFQSIKASIANPIDCLRYE
ncbi:MAG: ABC transporter permease [Candidatus Aminicenantes bacterium]|jgi:ABC-type antimicrobial peptide transport system permease subunit